jgi:1,4-alpha-glucan branching enzyme
MRKRKRRSGRWARRACPARHDSVLTWWREGSIYQVYPRSFQDASGDGVGDLEGIRTRLPYLAWLGVDAVWLSPFYRSPMVDFGYDVSDHEDVDSLCQLTAAPRLIE